jgi:nitrite reductase (NO-forming)
MRKKNLFVIPVLAAGVFLLAAAAGVSAADPASVAFTLKTNIGDKGMTYMGVGGDIDGVSDPVLKIPLGAKVQITLIDGEGAEHDIVIPQFNAKSTHVVGPGSKTSVSFQADKAGDFEYFCDLPGHKAAGMVGKISVSAAGKD